MESKEKKESASFYGMIMFITLIVGTVALLLKFIIGF